MSSYQIPPPVPLDPTHQQQAHEERFAQSARLLTQGKLMKALAKEKWPLPERYAIFSDVASEVAMLEAETEIYHPQYVATWTKRIQGKGSEWAILIGLFIPLGFLFASSGGEKFTFTTLHRLEPQHGNHFWFRRSWCLLGCVITGALAFLSGLFATMMLLFYAFAELSVNDLPVWYTLAAIPMCIITGYAYYRLKRHVVPPPLRIYAGGTFDLVKLKRVKEPQAQFPVNSAST